MEHLWMYGECLSRQVNVNYATFTALTVVYTLPEEALVVSAGDLGVLAPGSLSDSCSAWDSVQSSSMELDEAVHECHDEANRAAVQMACVDACQAVVDAKRQRTEISIIPPILLNFTCHLTVL